MYTQDFVLSTEKNRRDSLGAHEGVAEEESPHATDGRRPPALTID